MDQIQKRIACTVWGSNDTNRHFSIPAERVSGSKRKRPGASWYTRSYACAHTMIGSVANVGSNTFE